VAIGRLAGLHVGSMDLGRDNRPGPGVAGAVAFAREHIPNTEGAGMYLPPWPWNRVFVAIQSCVWFLILVFLANLARQKLTIAR